MSSSSSRSSLLLSRESGAGFATGLFSSSEAAPPTDSGCSDFVVAFHLKTPMDSFNTPLGEKDGKGKGKQSKPGLVARLVPSTRGSRETKTDTEPKRARQLRRLLLHVWSCFARFRYEYNYFKRKVIPISTNHIEGSLPIESGPDREDGRYNSVASSLEWTLFHLTIALRN